MVLLHGYTDSSFSYSRVLPLIDAKYRVFVLDQRGHGKSEKPEKGYLLTDFAADVSAFMDAKGIKQATIVGHSMGSLVAQQIAVSAPERVERLVLVGSTTTARNNDVIELQKAVNELKDPVPVAFAREFQDSTVHRQLPEDFMKRVVEESLKLPARVWREVLAGIMASDFKSELSKIKAPTLIIWGENDKIFGRDEQNILASKIPDAVLKIYPETGHCPNWERPEQFVKDLENFISEKRKN